MPQIRIDAEPRSDFGKGAARRLRRDGKIEEAEATARIVEQLEGTHRLYIHGRVNPNQAGDLERMDQLELEVASEFLLIAATLVELKSRRLLPVGDDLDLDEELAVWEERDLLLHRLVECKTFKEAAIALRVLAVEAGRSQARVAGVSCPTFSRGWTPRTFVARSSAPWFPSRHPASTSSTSPPSASP